MYGVIKQCFMLHSVWGAEQSLDTCCTSGHTPINLKRLKKSGINNTLETGDKENNLKYYLWTSCWSPWGTHCILFQCLGYPKVEIKSLEWMMSQPEELLLSSSILTSTLQHTHILLPGKNSGFIMVLSCYDLT